MSAPTTPVPLTRSRHHDVSRDITDVIRCSQASTSDQECIDAPQYIPSWVLPADELSSLISQGLGAAPDLIYARGIPPSISSLTNPPPFDRMRCTLTLIEVGFCRDLGCQAKLAEKTQKYEPLATALRRHWGEVDLICIPVGHAGTTLTMSIDSIALALAKQRPPTTTSRSTSGQQAQDKEAKAAAQDRRLVRNAFDSLCTLAQHRLLSIIAHRQQETRALDPARTRPPFSGPPYITSAHRPPPTPG